MKSYIINSLNENFRELANFYYFVDKSSIIYYINNFINTPQKYICVSRPRRFGKTSTANMLESFYKKNSTCKNIFNKLEISTDSRYNKYYERFFGKFNVIKVDISKMLFRYNIKKTNEISFSYYIYTTLLNEICEYYKNVEQKDLNIKDDVLDNDLGEILNEIYLSTREKFIFIIDEWDILFRTKTATEKDKKDFLLLLKELFKDNEYIALVYMTGILPIKKYVNHSDLNMFISLSMVSSEGFSDFIGFTDKDIKYLFKDKNRDLNEIKEWYDGYIIGGKYHIYNPISILETLRSGYCRNYWTSTETIEALEIYLKLSIDGLQESIMRLLIGESVYIKTSTFQNDINKFISYEDVLTLLVHLGYLTIELNKSGSTGYVKIPNKEIEEEFYASLSNIKRYNWNNTIKSMQDSNNLLYETWNYNYAYVENAIDLCHNNLSSILTYNKESDLACVVKIAYYSAIDYYIITREMPTGKGFADIVFIPAPLKNVPAMIIELKYDKTALGAINQIKNKQYIQPFQDYYGKILLVAINYDTKKKKHQCIIEVYDKK